MQNKSILLFLLLFVGLTSQAQDKKFQFGLNLFPNYSVGILTNDGTAPTYLETGVQQMETWKPSVSGNIFVEYKLNEKSSVGFGLGYQNNGERIKMIDLIFGVDPQTGLPIVDPSLPTAVKFLYNHHNIEIPLYYKYSFGSRWFLTGGISTILNVSNTVGSVQYFADGSKEKNSEENTGTDFRTLNFSGNIGCGLDYFKNEKIALFANPYIQYGVLGISKTASINRHFMSIGLSTGIRI